MQILIADDELGARTTLQELFKGSHDVLLAENGEQALKILEKTAVDLVITDHMMPKLTGLELIRRGKALSPSTSFILMTAYGTVEQAVEAIQLGADDYFMKPFELSEVEHRVRRIEELGAWRAETVLKRGEATGCERLIGKSPAIQAAKEFIVKVSTVPSPVLLLGPSGSGKEVMARAIHETGPRVSRPFVAINCASLSEQLMESELFGHEKGAFTGATTSKPGKFELAKGGTLFLDEVGEMPGEVQAKLLRVLQEKEFYRVGGVRQIKSDARVITATHRDLKKMVSEGRFREDLYFRLNVLSFEMPPLASRPGDIPALIAHFWARLSRDLGRSAEIVPDAMERLCAYAYPGNARELQNVLERLLVLNSEGRPIDVYALPPEIAGASVGNASPTSNEETGAEAESLGDESLTEMLDAIEARMIRKAMDQTGHNQVKAAELLKITRGALQYKLKKYLI